MRPATRSADGVLAGLATLTACLPMMFLFDANTWTRPALLITVVVVASGILARRLLPSRGAALAAQLIVATEAFFLLHGRGHLWFGLPTVDAFLAVNYVLYDARITVMQYSAPAPTTRGIIVATTLIVGVLALGVDYVAVTRKAPAAAGLVLLTGYLITATNTGAAMPWYAFALPAGLWMVMLGRDGMTGLRRWSTAVPLRSGGSRSLGDGVDGFATVARNLGVLSLAAAIVLPNVIPHLPTRFLGDGLGRTGSGVGNSATFELSTTLDLTRNLGDRSRQVIMRYRTSDPAPGPLKVATLLHYGGLGQFRAEPQYPATLVPDNGPWPVTPSPAASPDSPGRTYEFEMSESLLRAPQVALPTAMLSLDLPDGVTGTLFNDGTVYVSGRARTYAGTNVPLAPTQKAMEASDVTGSPIDAGPNDLTSMDLFVEPRAVSILDEILEDLVPEGVSDFEAAVTIQDHFRTSEYTYSLELAPPVRDESNRIIDLDPVSHFLVTKQGYCQQFATAMIMLARRYGMPARMAVGFLPGGVIAGERVVRASEAHAWPELFFEGVGWLRFEPTPGSRSGTTPIYARDIETDGSTDTETSRSTSSASTDPRAQPGADFPGREPTSGLDRPVWERIGALPRWVWWIVVAFLGACGALVLPVAAALHRRRRLAEAFDDSERIEILWQDMVSRIEDLGITTPGSLTPRQARTHLRERGSLDTKPTAALDRVIAAVERARYAPPTAVLEDPAQDVEAVVDAVGESRQLGARVRALLLPGAGTAAVASTYRRAVESTAVVVRRARALLTRRPR